MSIISVYNVIQFDTVLSNNTFFIFYHSSYPALYYVYGERVDGNLKIEYPPFFIHENQLPRDRSIQYLFIRY
jgi:hypothetical protein